MNETGTITVETRKAIATRSLQVTLQIGTQRFKSKKFKIEVFDCLPSMSLPKIRGDFKYQVEQEIPTIDALARTSDPDRCAVGEYGFNETVRGLSIDANGVLKIGNTNGISKTYLCVKVQVGHQSFLTTGFSVEVLDCYKYITLPEIWKQLATSTDERI